MNRENRELLKKVVNGFIEEVENEKKDLTPLEDFVTPLSALALKANDYLLLADSVKPVCEPRFGFVTGVEFGGNMYSAALSDAAERFAIFVVSSDNDGAAPTSRTDLESACNRLLDYVWSKLDTGEFLDYLTEVNTSVLGIQAEEESHDE